MWFFLLFDHRDIFANRIVEIMQVIHRGREGEGLAESKREE